jgi:transcriptional regulator with XRE-family HTH domain
MTRLRRAREAAGLTLDEAARRVGLSPATLRKAEVRGIAILAWPRVVKIARLLGRDVLDLL